MNRNFPIETKNLKLIHIAFFTAFALIIFYAENLMPKPFPFLKIGLANIVILILIFFSNLKTVLIVTAGKIILGGIISATILSPVIIISFFAGMTSLFTMLLLFKASLNFSVLGLSIAGAVIHNLSQLFIIRLLIIRNNSLFGFVPILILLGIVSGIITGFIAFKIMRKLNLNR